MRASSAGAFLVTLGLMVGCGGHGPSAPSSMPTPASGAGTSATQSLVAAAVSQAANTAMTVSRNGLSQTITNTCPDGGSTSISLTSTGGATSDTFTSSSRIEFTECRSQTVTINGDPAILTDGVFTFERTAGGVLSRLTATERMTGGLRFDAPGSSGRARYDCTMVMSMPLGSDGTPALPTITWSGTTTWEQPLGTVAVHSCGA